MDFSFPPEVEEFRAEVRAFLAENLTEDMIAATHDGTLHYKYMPRTGEWGTADVEYACLTPVQGSNAVIQERWVGDGTIAFQRARWEDMPTQYNIVNTLEALEILEFRGGSVTRSVGGKDLSDQRILK